jgi:hypothetical protein
VRHSQYLVLDFLSNKWGWWDSNSWPLGYQGSDTMSNNHINLIAQVIKWSPKIWFILFKIICLIECFLF